MSNMSPSKETITGGQIVKLTDVIAAELRKSDLPRDASQQVIESQGKKIAKKVVEDFRTRVGVISQSFIMEVNYDDPQWKKIDKSCYVSPVGIFSVADYPETETGKKLVRFYELAFDHDPTDDEVLAEMAAKNCRQTSRAEAETVIRQRYTEEQLAENPRVGLVGPTKNRLGGLGRGYVHGRSIGVTLDWHWAGYSWTQRYRFVVACK